MNKEDVMLLRVFAKMLRAGWDLDFSARSIGDTRQEWVLTWHRTTGVPKET